MTTVQRFYFTRTAYSGATFPIDGWDTSPQARLALSATRDASGVLNTGSSNGAGSPGDADLLCVQYVTTSPLPAGTFTGRLTAGPALGRSYTTGVVMPRIRVYLRSLAGTVKHLATAQLPNNLTASNIPQWFADIAMDPVTTEADDLLVVEVGGHRLEGDSLYMRTTSGASATVAEDMPLGESTQLSGRATWIDFTWEPYTPPEPTDPAAGGRYQWGVDRVAYYPLMNYPSAGEVWNGVTTIQEDSDGGEVSSMFYGGEKYGVYLAKEDFVATITGFYLPPSLERAAGYHPLGNGFIATLQPKEPFDLTYRTFVGDDHFGPEAHYRIHIVYGCMIEPYSTTHKTSTTRPEPGTTSWRIQTLPPYDIYTPSATAHYIIDTRYADPEVVEEVEEILYGRPGVPARMPGTNEWPHLFGFGNMPM